MNPVIYLRGVRHADLERLVEFIYLGKYIWELLETKKTVEFFVKTIKKNLRKIIFISVCGILIFFFRENECHFNIGHRLITESS